MKGSFTDALRRARPVGSAIERPKAEKTGYALTPVVVASGRNDDFLSIKEALNPSRWLVLQSRTACDVFSLLQSAVVPVIVCDSELYAADWKQLRADSVPLRTGAVVVLISASWNPDIWREVTSEGVLDVLTRPLHRDDVCAVLETAHQLWKVRRSANTSGAESLMKTLRAAS